MADESDPTGVDLTYDGVPIIKYVGIEEVACIFADNIAITRNAFGIMTLHFFQYAAPIADPKTPPPALTEVRAKCVSRIALQPDTAHSVMAALKSLLEKHAASQKPVAGE